MGEYNCPCVEQMRRRDHLKLLGLQSALYVFMGRIQVFKNLGQARFKTGVGDKMVVRMKTKLRECV